MSVPKPGDLGIILAKAGAVGVSYVDISGNTQAYTLIHGLYAAQGAALVAGRDYSRPAIGKSQKLSLFVTVTLAGATDIKLKLQSRYQEGDAWADMQTQRCDTGSTTLEQTFSADGTVLVQTINELSTGQIQLVVLAVGAIAAGTIVIVKARCTI